MATSTIPCPAADTGWVNITPLAGLTVGSVFAVRRIGRTVFMTGQNLTLPASSSANPVIGNVGTNFRPATARWDVHQARPNTDASLYIIIRQNGNIELNVAANTAVNSLFFSTAYPSA